MYALHATHVYSSIQKRTGHTRNWVIFITGAIYLDGFRDIARSGKCTGRQGDDASVDSIVQGCLQSIGTIVNSCGFTILKCSRYCFTHYLCINCDSTQKCN